MADSITGEMTTQSGTECWQCDQLKVDVDSLKTSFVTLSVFFGLACVGIVALAIFIFRQQILKLVSLFRQKVTKAKATPSGKDATGEGHLEPYSDVNPDKKIDHLYHSLDRENTGRSSGQKPKIKYPKPVEKTAGEDYVEMDNTKKK